MGIVDLTPAARNVGGLVEHIGDDQLASATPCGQQRVADLLDHVNGLALAFAAAAAKDLGPMTSTAPAPDGARLPATWRQDVPPRLIALAQAWADPAAWDGMTQVGGVDLPGAVAGRIALNELVLHGWDLARATGLPYEPEPAALQACLDALIAMYPPDHLDRRTGIFGPPVEVAATAPLVDRTVAFSGRDPGWSAPA
jgi:uncharacterized protein (TIGR03086 family)